MNQSPVSQVASILLFLVFSLFTSSAALAQQDIVKKIIPSINMLLLSDTGKPSPKLLFRSGFESAVSVANDNQKPLILTPIKSGYRRIVGDDISGFSWDQVLTPFTQKQLTEMSMTSPSIWGSFNNGIHRVNASKIKNRLENVTGHNKNQTTALYQESLPGFPLYDDEGNELPTPQTPFQIDNITNDPEEYYISYWMKIDNTSMQTPYRWRIIWQYKTDHFDYQAPSKPGFRISVFIYTDKNGKAFWHVQGDDQDVELDEHWEIENKVVPVPRNEWFKVEVYSKVSAKDDGIFWAKINGQEIAYKNGQNLGSTEDSIDFIMLWQLYGNSHPAHQWIDDVEIWSGAPE